MPKNGKQWIIGWTPESQPIDLTRKIIDSDIADAVSAIGGLELYCSPGLVSGTGSGDPSAQANCVQSFITQNVDAIAIYPVDQQAIIPSILAANKAGIPVFIEGTEPANKGINVVLSYESPNALGTSSLAKQVVSLLTKKYGSPKGTILEISGNMTTSDAQQRHDGFASVIAQYPDIKLTSKDGKWDVATGTTEMIDWFTANPTTDVVFIGGDLWSAGIKTALKGINRWTKVGDPNHVIAAVTDSGNFTLNAMSCGYFDANVDLGWTYGIAGFGKAIAMYVTTGQAPTPGTAIEISDPFKTAMVISDSNISGPAIQATPFVVTQATAGNPHLYGNEYMEPPNGANPSCDSLP